MTKSLLLIFPLICLICSCNKKEVQIEPEITYGITSKEFINNLLFVNKNNYQITTEQPGTFASNDSHITITPKGLITSILSGEVVAIDITWINTGKKTKLYAVGATDNNYIAPFVEYHGAESNDPYSQYVQGWETLRKLAESENTYAIILRHADADNGKDFSETTGPSNWWLSCDNTLARQLNTQGIERATELGLIYKDLQLPIVRVISSEFCRALKTAELINAGLTIKTDGRINHPAYNVYGNLFKGLGKILSELPVDKKITLISTHHPINEFHESLPTFPKVSVFNWTGAYFIKIAANKSFTYEGAASYGMMKLNRDLKLNKL